MPDIYGLDASGRKWGAVARAIAQEVALPCSAEVDQQARFPNEALKSFAEQNLFGLCLPGETGGQAQSPRVFAAVVEEISQACASTAMVYVMHVTAAQALAASSRLEHRDGLLREIAEGRHLTTLALSERGSRSQFWAPVSRLATDDATGGYSTSACKSWVTAANYANSYISSAQVPNAKSPLESVLYLVRQPAAGVRVAGRFDGLGLRGNDSAPVEIQDLIVAQSDLITELGAGASAMLDVILPWFCVGTAAMSHGLCLAAISATAAHLSNTRFEHDGTTLRDLPNLRARLAEMSLRTEQSRALLGFSVAAMEQPDDETLLYVLQSRIAALEAAVAVTDLAMKACGGAAFSKHLGVERLFRDARAGWVMAPTVDHLRDFVGRVLTGLPML